MGNMSKTYIDYDVRPAMFVKEDCNETGFDFQSLLYHTVHLWNGFEINQPITYKDGEARFALLEDLDYEITIENSTTFGINMARIHNLSAKLMLSKELPYMDNKIMPGKARRGKAWKELNLSPSELSIRESVMKFAEYTPIKTLPLHRDFRLHNIVYNGTTWNLIDFDFAAYDDVSMEVMGMVVDFLTYGIDYAEAFLKAYIEESNLNRFDGMALNYLLYLASSCFPYDKEDTIETEAFERLKRERYARLMVLLGNVKKVELLIKNIENEQS